MLLNKGTTTLTPPVPTLLVPEPGPDGIRPAGPENTYEAPPKAVNITAVTEQVSTPDAVKLITGVAVLLPTVVVVMAEQPLALLTVSE